jgi:hypothetical protein
MGWGDVLPYIEDIQSNKEVLIRLSNNRYVIDKRRSS